MGKDPLDALAPDAPPKADKKPKQTRRRTTGPTMPQIKEGLDAFVGMVGVGLIATGDDYCGQTVLEKGPELTESLIELAKQDPRVKKALASLSQTSAWGGVFIAASSIAIPVFAHHGIIPPHIAAVVGRPLEDVAMDPGGARNADRPDRPGQDDARPGDPAP